MWSLPGRILLFLELDVPNERFTGTSLPLRYHEVLTPGRAKASIAFCVLLALAFMVPTMLLGIIWEPVIQCSMYRVSISNWFSPLSAFLFLMQYIPCKISI